MQADFEVTINKVVMRVAIMIGIVTLSFSGGLVVGSIKTERSKEWWTTAATCNTCAAASNAELCLDAYVRLRQAEIAMLAAQNKRE